MILSGVASKSEGAAALRKLAIYEEYSLPGRLLIYTTMWLRQ